jgi:hypothetical protein
MYVFTEMAVTFTAYVWAGATDTETEGTFKWVVGGDEIPDFWEPGQPNNSGGDQKCLPVTKATFHDRHCADKLVFVCEKHPDI